MAAMLTLTAGYGQPTGGKERDLALTDASVERAIQAAVAFIKGQRQRSGHWERGTDTRSNFWAGDTALATLALLYADEDPRSEFMAESLTWLAQQPLSGTYCHGLRAHALALVPGRTYRGRLEADFKWLLAAAIPKGKRGAGGYGYAAANPGAWDNSNSQYGVLGTWMASSAGLDAPAGYWPMIGEHWLTQQRPDGGWGYTSEGPSTGSMTAAGLASLFVVHDQLYKGRPREVATYLAGIERGLDWMGANFDTENPGGELIWRYYYLYGVERVGRASGSRYFRDQPWFRLGAEALLKEQTPAGSWPGAGLDNGELRNTAFALMFLCHGRAPLTFNKLLHGNDWKKTPRDAHNFTRYAEHAFERMLNWQHVRLDNPLEDLLESPILYLRGENAWTFEPDEVEVLREYCRRGGFVLGVCGDGSEEFAASFERLGRALVPDQVLRPLPPEHALFSGEIQFAIKSAPKLLEVHNGIRPILLLCKEDIAKTWNSRPPRGAAEEHYQLAANIYLYATDKSRIRSRLLNSYIPVEAVEIKRTIRLARVRHRGRWEIEPQGWSRLSAHLNNTVGTRLELSAGVRLDDAELQEFKIAHMAGLEALELSPDELTGLRRFISNGGTLLADASGGADAFLNSLEAIVRDVLKSDPAPIAQGAALLTGREIPGATSLAGMGLRRSARGTNGGFKYPRLRSFTSGARHAVICCPLDLTASLLGTNIYNLRGYEADAALKIMQNLLAYANLPVAEKARLH